MSTAEKDQRILCLTILGEPASKANQRRLMKRGRNGVMFIKSEKALSYRKSFLWQLKQYDFHPFTDDVMVEITIWYASRRPDLDESLILDLLQEGGVYLNDRQVTRKIIAKRLDRDNPRCAIRVRVAPSD